VVAGRHHEIGRPRYFSAEPVKDWGGRLGDPIVAIGFASQMGLIGANTILAVSQAPRDNPRLLESMQDAQQGRLGDSGEAIDVVQRRDRLLLQGLQNIKSAFETSDRFGAGHWVSQLIAFSGW
jgi:hypothetical protein